MQAYFEPEQAFSISMPQIVFKISISYKKSMFLLELCNAANIDNFIILESITSSASPTITISFTVSKAKPFSSDAPP